MSISRMDRKLVFQTRTSLTSGVSHEPMDEWKDHVTVWGEFLPARGYNKDQGGQPVNVGEDVFRIHYRDDITHEMRVSHNGESKKITSLEEFGRRRYLIVRTQRLA